MLLHVDGMILEIDTGHNWDMETFSSPL